MSERMQERKIATEIWWIIHEKTWSKSSWLEKANNRMEQDEQKKTIFKKKYEKKNISQGTWQWRKTVNK